MIREWSICGIGDGSVAGSGYGCGFNPSASGPCYDPTSTSVAATECQNFLRDTTTSSTTTPTSIDVNISKTHIFDRLGCHNPFKETELSSDFIKVCAKRSAIEIIDSDEQAKNRKLKLIGPAPRSH